jgi:hypothetical protein
MTVVFTDEKKTKSFMVKIFFSKGASFQFFASFSAFRSLNIFLRSRLILVIHEVRANGLRHEKDPVQFKPAHPSPHDHARR